MKCVHAMEKMDEKFRAACRSPAANVDQVLHVSNSVLFVLVKLLFSMLTIVFVQRSRGTCEFNISQFTTLNKI